MPEQASSDETIASGQQRALAEQILRISTIEEAKALAAYFDQLLLIRRANLDLGEKLRLAVRHTTEPKLTLPLLTLIVKEVQAVWGRIGLPGRLGIVAGAATLAAFGRAGAGIATLGAAVGVPLWVVAGGGAPLARAFLELFYAKHQRLQSYDVIEAEFTVVECQAMKRQEPDNRQAAVPLPRHPH